MILMFRSISKSTAFEMEVTAMPRWATSGTVLKWLTVAIPSPMRIASSGK